MLGPGSFWKALEARRTLATWGLEVEAGDRFVDSLHVLGRKAFYPAHPVTIPERGAHCPSQAFTKARRSSL